MALQNIIFDFGGVLIDWNPYYLYDKVFADHAQAEWFISQVCPMDWNVRCDAGRPWPEALAERIALYPEYEQEIRWYRSRWIEMVGAEIPGMYDYIKELKGRGLHLYGLTNWALDTFAEIQEGFQALKLLEGYVISGAEGVVKPDPRIYRTLLQRYGLKASECVFIDDNPANVAAARELGWQGIRFTGSAQLRQDLEALL